MTVLGVSVYPDIRPLDEIKEYLRLCSKYGFTRVFSSMFSVEGTKEEVLAYFRELIEAAHEVNMQVSLDVNPDCFNRMGATVEDISVFDSIHCDILRMDMSFGVEGDLKLVNNPYGILIEFNASMATTFEELMKAGADKNKVLACHNFYPQRYTGLKWKRFLEINEKVNKTGVRLGAFVASNHRPTHGVWDAICGLPTVERMRDLPIDLQARLLMGAGCTDILIGNAYASEDELYAMQQIIKPMDFDEESPVIKFMMVMGKSHSELEEMVASAKKIRVTLCDDITDLEKHILLDFMPHTEFGDSSEWIWRSRGSRMAYGDGKSDLYAREYNKDHFEVGDVVIVNNNYAHYAGEIHIVKEPTIYDGTCNLIGHIDSDERLMMDVIQDGDIVQFLVK